MIRPIQVLDGDEQRSRRSADWITRPCLWMLVNMMSRIRNRAAKPLSALLTDTEYGYSVWISVNAIYLIIH